MLHSTRENFQTIKSLDEAHCFKSLSIKFGFIGRKHQSNVKDFHYLKQIHSPKVVTPNESTSFDFPDKRTEADGLFTSKPRQKIAVRTADCLPLLIANQQGNSVMALHAGWRGLATDIIRSGLFCYNENPSELAVLMGPCISRKKFEVGPEVIDAFNKHSKNFMTQEVFASCYEKGQDDRSFCLRSYAYYTLRSLGVLPQNISVYDQCTQIDNHLWYSYRREAPLKAHNWSWIALY